MRPNVGQVVSRWSWGTIRVYTETIAKQDFEKQTVQLDIRTIKAVTQPAQASDINVDDVDWNKKHILIHSRDAVAIGEYAEYKGTKYKIIQLFNWSEFGFYESIGQEHRE